MQKRLPILYLTITLLLAVSVFADWEEVQQNVYLGTYKENYKGTDVLDVDNYFIKLNDLDYESEKALVTISDKQGITYYTGEISRSEDFMQPGKIWVRWNDFRVRNGHPEVSLKVFVWQQLSLVDFNIPQLMNLEDEYVVYMDWANVADTEIDVFFNVVAQDGFVTAQKLDQNFKFRQHESRRIYFRLRPERYATTGPNTAARSQLTDLSLELLVYSAGSSNLLRRANLGKFSLTPNPTAFVEEIVTPLTQFVGREYEVKVKVRNSGYPQKSTGDYVKDSFQIKLEAPGFKIKDSDFQYARMDAFTSQELTFTVQPLSGGVRNIVASFYVDRKPAAALAERVVVKGAKTLVLGDMSNIPREYHLGNVYKLPVSVFNKGDFTEEVVMRVSSPFFTVKSNEFVVKLFPNTDKQVEFEVIPTIEGNTKLLFEAITASENFRITQYFKGEGFAIDEKAVSVSVSTPGSQPIIEQPRITPEPLPVEPATPMPEEQVIEEKEEQKVVEKTPIVPPSAPQQSISLINLLLLIVGLIVVFLLITFIVKKSSKKSSHKKKKRKEGDFELE